MEFYALEFGQKFGALIRRTREEQGLSQKDVLDLIGQHYPQAPMSTSHLSSIERGKYDSTRAQTVRMFKLALDLCDEDIEACRTRIGADKVSLIEGKSPDLSRESISKLARQVSERSGLRRTTFEQVNETQDSVYSVERAVEALGSASVHQVDEIDAMVSQAKELALLAETEGAQELLRNADAILQNSVSDYDDRRYHLKVAQANLALSQRKFDLAAKNFELAASIKSFESEEDAANQRHEFANVMYRHSRTKGSEAARYALVLYEANRPFCLAHEDRKHWATGEIDRASCLSEIACLTKATDGKELLGEAVSNLRTVMCDPSFDSLSFEIRGYAANSLGLALLDLSDRQEDNEASASVQKAYDVFSGSRALFQGKEYEADFLVHMVRSCQRLAAQAPLFGYERLTEAEKLLDEAAIACENYGDRLGKGYVEAQRLRLMADVLSSNQNNSSFIKELFLRQVNQSTSSCMSAFDRTSNPIDFGRFKTAEAEFLFSCASSDDIVRDDTFLHRASKCAGVALGSFETSYAPLDWARAKSVLGQISYRQSAASSDCRGKLLKSMIHFNEARAVFEKAGLLADADLARRLEHTVQAQIKF